MSILFYFHLSMDNLDPFISIIAYIISIAIIIGVPIVAVGLICRAFGKLGEKLAKLHVSQPVATIVSLTLNVVMIIEFLLWLLSFGLYDGVLLPRLKKIAALGELEALQERLAEATSPEEVLALCEHQPPLSLQFQKSEKILWIIPDCGYLTIKKQVNFSGGSAGLSFGVTKRVGLDIGRVGGSLDEYERLERVDVGTLVLTTQHIYFQGQGMERLRIGLDGLVSAGLAEDRADGFMVQRGGMGSRPEYFVSDEIGALTLEKLLLWLKDSKLAVASSGPDVDGHG